MISLKCENQLFEWQAEIGTKHSKYFENLNGATNDDSATWSEHSTKH